MTAETAASPGFRHGGKPRPHLASLLLDWERHAGGRAVVRHKGVRALGTSYGHLLALAWNVSAELRRRAIAPGDRVVLWGENSAEWIGAFFGCMIAGAVAVPLDAAGGVAFVERVVAEVSPKLIVADAGLLGLLSAAVPALTFADLPKLADAGPERAIDPSVGPETPLQIIFTSGTTSVPKGVVHTHRNVLASVEPIAREIARYRRYARLVHPLRFLHTLPLSHVFGQFMGMWLPPLLGAEVHFADGVEPSRMLALLRRERISVLVAVPRILELLRAALSQRFSTLQADLDGSGGWPAWKRWWRFRAVHGALGWKFWALICGGATLPGVLESFWNGLGFALIQGYGMTETAALVTLNHPFHIGKGTLGKPLPGREVRLSHEGEIEVRGDMLAAGSWQGGRFQPREGEWLATGDLGVREPSGELRFAGRKGDVIVTAAGMNVYPADLEAALRAQPGVRGCVVVPCHFPRGVEPVAAVQFLGDEAALRAATEAANRKLVAFQQIRYVLRWPEPAFPYTSTGKLRRREVGAWAEAQLAGAAEGRQSEDVPDLLLRLVAEVTGEPALSADDAQRLTEDLHLDSLGRAQLQSAIEARFGVEVSDGAMASAETLGDLRRALEIFPAAPAPAVGFASTRTSAALQAVSTQPVTKERLRLAKWPWKRPVWWLRTCFIEMVVRPLVGLLARPAVQRDLTLAPSGPVLVIANHVNTYDLPLVLYALPKPLRRRLATAMSAELLEDLRRGRGQGSFVLNLLARPAYWLLLALFNVFPLPRLRGFRDSFAHAGAALDRGDSVLIFPEGQRSYTGELQPFRPGIGLLVQAADVPVLPVALLGMGVVSRTGSGWFRPEGLRVRVGELVRFDPATAAGEITRRLEIALRALGPS